MNLPSDPASLFPIEPPFEDGTELATLFALAGPGNWAESESDPAVETGLFQRYEHLRELGQGAMGTVSLMRDTLLRRPVAYKQIKQEALSEPGILARFRIEAQITAQLEHPGVVPVYTLEIQPGGALAYAMKVVEGETLKDCLQTLRLQLGQRPRQADWEQALRPLLTAFIQVCDALAFAHSRGVIHQDLKPSNIMLGRFNEVYVVDWGIARFLDRPADDVPTAAGGQISGTPRYMSPEQIRNRPGTVGPASDQYTLGLILQELVCLAPPFTARSLPEMLTKILKGERAPLVSALPGLKIPLELKAIITKSTALKAAARYPGVQDLADDLRAFLQDRETRACPDSPWRRIQRWVRHHSAQALGLATGVLLLCSLAIGGSLWSWQQSQQHTRLRRQALEQARRQTLLAGQRLDSYLGRFEAQAERLAAAATEAWLRGQTLGPPPLTLADLGARRLDTGAFGTYAMATSFSQPLWLGPLPRARALTPLTFEFQQAFARTRDPQAVTQAWLAARQTQPSPLQWALLTLPEARRLLYPAPADGRLESRLRATLPSLPPLQPRWGKRLAGFAQATDVVPVSVGLRDDQGQSLGMAALFVQTQALQQVLQAEAPPALQAAWITQPEEGLISGAAPLDWPAAVTRGMELLRSGFEIREDQLYVYQPLSTGGWYVVLRFDFQGLLAEVPRVF
ncbi:MAG: serine/threonine protein kinase [Candidatus Sericytochromatia bacterium]